jgi:DNA polymerase I-like protein with 3'-5' exonuclease and polymerase domains
MEILLESHKDCAEEAQLILVKSMVDAGNKYVKHVKIAADSYIANCWKKG